MHEFKIPFGPQHPALLEAVHLELTVDDEIVKKVRLKMGYNHRGIEKALEERNWSKGLFLSERICGICGSAHTTCFVNGIERVLRLEIPERAKYLRVIFMELERIQSHMLWLAIFAHELGFDTFFNYALRDREHINDILEMISGNRIHQSNNEIGGVRRNISYLMSKNIERKLDFLNKRTEFYLRLAKELRRRTKNVGNLRRKKALKLNVVGPVARGSGIAYDIRRVDPYLIYNDLDFKVIREKDGDSYARLRVRLREIHESIKIIQQCLNELPKGTLKVMPHLIFFEKEVMSRVEAPRGELVYYIRVGQDSTRPERVKIRTPTLANLHAISTLIVNSTLADVPVIVSSLDPCITCGDRLTVIDEAGNRKILKKEELLCHYHHSEH